VSQKILTFFYFASNQNISKNLLVHILPSNSFSTVLKFCIDETRINSIVNKIIVYLLNEVRKQLSMRAQYLC
jgi:hypothetical protein